MTMPSLWAAPPAEPLLGAKDVHVWRVGLDVSPEAIGVSRAVLSDDEQTRAEHFKVERARDAYVVTRAALRNIVARYLRRDPSAIRFAIQSRGKPVLEPVPDDRPITFNVSHSGSYALIAVAEGRPIGIDIEVRRSKYNGTALANRFFSSKEVAVLNALPKDQQEDAFLRCWTRKEAYIKARGEGMAIPLDSFDVTLAPNDPAALLTIRSSDDHAGRWTLRSIDVPRDYAAAIVVEGEIATLITYEFNR